MLRKRNLTILLVCGVLAALVVISGAAAQVGGGFAIPWWTLDNGGARSQGGPYTVYGTIGQVDTGTLAGGNYRINGGFWDAPGALITPQEDIFLPTITRTQP